MAKKAPATKAVNPKTAPQTPAETLSVGARAKPATPFFAPSR